MAQRAEQRGLPVIGWREWVTLPVLQVAAVKAKVDTGARSSALHAFNLRLFERDGCDVVSFEIHPMQRTTRGTIVAEAEVVEFRSVRSSGGHVTRRPVIITPIQLLGQTWDIELTLASRDTMGFRMLLGREAVRKRFLVDPGRSYSGGIPSSVRSARTRRSKKKRRDA